MTTVCGDPMCNHFDKSSGRCSYCGASPATADTTKYTPCGGCGATNPKDRCIGCFHVFFEGDWPDKKRDTEPTSTDGSDNLVRKLNVLVAEVERTERENTRNAHTDYKCRLFFVEHGKELISALAAMHEGKGA